MAQKTFTAGSVLTASDINTYLSGEGGAWTSYTPTIDQGASTNIAKTVTYSKYARYGRTIIWNFTLDLTASGTAASNVLLTLPVTAASNQGVRGAGQIYDASTTTSYAGIWRNAGSTTQVAFATDVTGTAYWGTNAPVSIALATGDVLTGSITYEAAS